MSGQAFAFGFQLFQIDSADMLTPAHGAGGGTDVGYRTLRRLVTERRVEADAVLARNVATRYRLARLFGAEAGDAASGTSSGPTQA